MILRPALTLLLTFTLLCGVVYPAVTTLLGQTIFPHQANGSLVEVDGKVIGSSLIGKPFTGDRYFWSRPSATPEKPYNPSASSGSNLGPTNPTLLEAAGQRAKSYAAAQARVPVDLVTSSASGLDPHISPEGALFQVERVARARGLSPEQLRAMVERHVEGRTFGILGEPRVNVLLLNLELDRTSTSADR